MEAGKSSKRLKPLLHAQVEATLCRRLLLAEAVASG